MKVCSTKVLATQYHQKPFNIWNFVAVVCVLDFSDLIVGQIRHFSCVIVWKILKGMQFTKMPIAKA